MNKEKEKEESKEDFCPSCLIVPLAMMATGGAAGSKIGSNKKNKKIYFWTGIISIILAMFFALYYIINRKNCKSCL